MRTVPAREAKNRFGSVIDEAQREPVTITRKGRPAVVILSHEEYELMGGARMRLARSVENLRREAEKNGLTDEILDSILEDDGSA